MFFMAYDYFGAVKPVKFSQSLIISKFTHKTKMVSLNVGNMRRVCASSTKKKPYLCVEHYRVASYRNYKIDFGHVTTQYSKI